MNFEFSSEMGCDFVFVISKHRFLVTPGFVYVLKFMDSPIFGELWLHIYIFWGN